MRIARVVLPLFALGHAALGLAAETRTDFAVDLAAGYDSNPVLARHEADGSPFTELRVSGWGKIDLTKAVTLYANVRGRSRWYSERSSDADDRRAEVEAGLAVTPAVGSRRRVSLAVGGIYETIRETFIDPETREAYLVATPDPSDPSGDWIVVDLANRLDLNRAGVFTDVRWRPHANVLLGLEVTSSRTDFVDDYDAVSVVAPLDYRTTSILPSVLIRLASGVSVKLLYDWSERAYDDQLARGPSGDLLDGSRRCFQYQGYGVSFRFALPREWAIRVGHTGTDRVDRFAGYYDYAGASYHAQVGKRLGRRTYFELHGSHRRIDYENATVGNEPDGSIRGGRIRQWAGRLEHALGAGRLFLFFEGGAVDSDDRDPVYSYNREWLLSGVRFKP